MKTFLIFLGLALALIIGQASFLRPSPREKGLMALREEARRLGLNPRLLPPPEWLKTEVPGRLVACYSLFVEEGHRGLPYWRIERQSDDSWWTLAGDGAVLGRLELPALASALLAIEVRANAINLYWTESLGPDALPAIEALLRQIKSKLE